MKDLTDITFLLDRTGSMDSIRNDVVGGFNSFLKSQKEATGETVMTLIQFDSQDPHEVKYECIRIQDVDEMKPRHFVPRAATPLLDAMGQAIMTVGLRLSKMPDEERPDKVVFVVFTDGYENASRNYSSEWIKEMVEEYRDSYKWQFVFLGAEIDAFEQGDAIGISKAHTLSSSREGTSRALNMVGEKVAKFSVSGAAQDLAWTDEERKEVEK